MRSDQRRNRLDREHIFTSVCSRRVLWKSAKSLASRSLEDVFNHSGIHFAGLVIKGLTTCIQYEDMRNVALVVLLDQLMLLRRELNVKIYDHEVHLGAGFVVQFNRTPGLPL